MSILRLSVEGKLVGKYIPMTTRDGKLILTSCDLASLVVCRYISLYAMHGLGVLVWR